MAANHFILIIEAIINDEQRLSLLRDRRYLRDSSNPLNLPSEIFRKLFRFKKDTASYIFNMVDDYMRDSVKEPHIPKLLRFFTALHFYAQGSYQKGVGQDYLLAMSQSSVSRCIEEMTHIIVDNLTHLIHFPTTPDEMDVEKTRFNNIQNGFPGIIGAIDCTHIGIFCPAEHGICNANLKILAINARFPGSVHDSAIWQTSSIKRLLQHLYDDGHRNFWLLGDSGYPLQPWLITPVLNPITQAQRNYNNAHKSLRNVVERVNGVLKQRFRCLIKYRQLHYTPEKAANIINACPILHNICINVNDIFEDNIDLDDNGAIEYHDDDDDLNGRNEHDGRDVRNRIINMYI